MKIANAELQMASAHASSQQHELKESLRAWIGNRRPDFEGGQPTLAVSTQPLPTVQISEAGKAAQSSEASAIQDSVEAVKNDPMLRLLRAMIAMLTGKEAEVFDASDLGATASAPATANPSPEAPPVPANANYGIEYDRRETYTETEQTDFSAQGVIQTTDGKRIEFSVSLSMSRSYSEESSISIREGNARKTKDPLVLNFDGKASQLTNRRFKFDLDSDGSSENINFVTSGSGFLALDRNGDGKINNGKELFGTESGDGFADLAAFDTDRNGWIDENDSVFAQLRVWIKDASGKDMLSTLKQANVGAIALARVETPFDIKNGSNELQGQIRSSGVFLRESGGVGTVQQVDLTI